MYRVITFKGSTAHTAYHNEPGGASADFARLIGEAVTGDAWDRIEVVHHLGGVVELTLAVFDRRGVVEDDGRRFVQHIARVG